MCGTGEVLLRLAHDDPAERARALAALIAEHRLGWEMLPDEAPTRPGTWAAPVEHGLPLGALLRQLPRLTRLGLLATGSCAPGTVTRQLTDPEALRRARMHPVSVLVATTRRWHGEVHPFQALQRYRRETGIAARLVVVGMTATAFSIAEPSDAGMLDVAGFDAAVPGVISDFSAGR